MTHFIIKASPIIIIDLVSVVLLHKLTETIRTCSIGYTEFIPVDALGAGTHTYTCTNIIDKRNQLYPSQKKEFANFKQEFIIYIYIYSGKYPTTPI